MIESRATGRAPRCTEPSPVSYWDRVVEVWAATGPQRLWRRYTDELNARWLAAWLPAGPIAHALKTDTFDEAIGDLGVYAKLVGAATTVTNLDVSPAVLAHAQRQRLRVNLLGGDVCHLPLRTGAVDLVVSTSTLDHLESVEQIGQALAELCRILRPGGRLLLTLDNRRNPIVALRSILPHAWLRRLRLVPYQTGANCGPEVLQRLATRAGFELLHVGSLMHCPRVVCVNLAAFIERWGGPRAAEVYVGALLACERLARWPTRFLTGYFVTLVAARPHAE